MLCSNCGKAFESNHRFCYGCGAALPEPNAAPGEGGMPSAVAGESGPLSYAAAAPAVAPAPAQECVPPPPPIAGYVPPPITSPVALQVAPVRYAGFMVLALAVIVCASVALFFIVQAAMMHALKDVYLRGGPLAVAAVVLAKLLADQSKQIKSHPEPKGFNNLLKASLCVALMFLTVAGLLGWQLGTRRSAFDAMIADWAHLSRVGRRISDLRNATDNLEGQLEMYKAIESDVADMDQTASRLLDEERQFADRYPEYRTQSEKESADVQICVNRARLLQQQIAVAKKISAQDQQQRPVLWVQQMQPLLEAESALDGNAGRPAATDESTTTDDDD